MPCLRLHAQPRDVSWSQGRKPFTIHWGDDIDCSCCCTSAMPHGGYVNPNQSQLLVCVSGKHYLQAPGQYARCIAMSAVYRFRRCPLLASTSTTMRQRLSLQDCPPQFKLLHMHALFMCSEGITDFQNWLCAIFETVHFQHAS